MSAKFQSIRGMHDILPDTIHHWQAVEKVVHAVLGRYGYQEIRLPVVETAALFTHAIGDATDVVSKEMYTFADRAGDQLSLRPEGTAGCVRAVIQNGLVARGSTGQRLWYQGPMFRYERPQRGRYRCFHQIGAEVFGYEGPDVDAELVSLTARIWRELKLKDVRLEINTLATRETRAVYRDRLFEYFQDHAADLDEDSQVRLHKNVLRILDSKNRQMRPLIDNAPILLDHLDSESKEHFEQFRQLLDTAGIEYQVNPRLVRGLDYYSRTVFEFITDALGTQGTLCGGGRYDYLVEQQGGPPTPAVGFSMGLERIVELVSFEGLENSHRPHVYVITKGALAGQAAFGLCERLRDELPWLRLMQNAGDGSFKSQFKRADRSGAALALVIGDEEVEQQTVTLKPLRNNDEQSNVSMDTLGRELNEWRDQSRF